MTRRTPLDDRRFRSVLLAVAGIPIAALYVWRTLVLPAITGAVPLDFSDNYMAAAAQIRAGRDPFDLCAINGCGQATQTLPLAGAQYVTPLPVAWMLQPLVGARPGIQLALLVALLQVSVLVFLVTTLRAAQVRDWAAFVLSGDWR